MHIEFRFRFFILILLFFVAIKALALPLAATVPTLTDSDLETLKTGSTLVRYPENSSSIMFAPKGSTGEVLRVFPQKAAMPVLVETAFLVRGYALDETNRLKLVNKLLEVQSLSGITYYSERRNGIAVLFDEVFQVAGAGSKKPIEYPQVKVFSSQLTRSIHLKDSNFGSSWYELILEFLADGLYFSLQNQRSLNFLAIRAFSENDVRIRITITPVDEGIYIAAICAANPSKLVALMVDINSAMEKRLIALQGWVIKRISGL